MRYTYGILNRLERLADKVIDLNGNLVEKVPNNGIHSPPYLVSKVPISQLKIPNGWKISKDHIVCKSTLIYIVVKNDMS